jgi:hypothetical protein
VNSKKDNMAISFDSDSAPELMGVPAAGSLLSTDDQLTAGIRVTRAQFAKMMGCSRQAVTEWVRAGRLTVGSDGRFDPRKAVASLLRTGDPARLRAKVLQPMADELAAYRGRIVDLEAALGQALQTVEKLRTVAAEVEDLRENLDFHEASASEFCAIFLALQRELQTHWPALAALPDNEGGDVIIGWLDIACETGAELAGPLLAPEVEGGEGESLLAALPGGEGIDVIGRLDHGPILAPPKEEGEGEGLCSDDEGGANE